jgi:riboflavin kinase/FMN adenylyltransferase
VRRCLLEHRGRVEPGRRLGRALHAPTANLALPPAAAAAPRGTYAAVVEGLERPYAAVAHLGVRPSVEEGGALLLEAHLLDFTGDLYGRELVVRLEHRVAGETRCPSRDALAWKIAADVAAVHAWFAAHPLDGRAARRRAPGA